MGGKAHDFNNLLTAIMGNISLAKILTSPQEKKVRERLNDAEIASLRARDLTQRLLTFSAGGAPVRKTIQLAKLISDSAGLALSGSKAICEYEIPEDLWAVYADEGQIGQVINNLIINADQAMPGGGKISVRCENCEISAVDALPLEPGGMGGKVAIKKLVEIDHKVKAIVSSGYSNDPIMSNYQEYRFAGVVLKPYKVDELSEQIRKVLLGGGE